MSRASFLIIWSIWLILFMGLPRPACAADTVELEISGVEGDAEDNLREALALPHGMVRDGKVDRLWLERFARQAPEKAGEALRPFGYYNARVAAEIKTRGKEEYLLKVYVQPGPPVRVAQVEVKLQGQGAGQEELTSLVRGFPLVQGGILVQPAYDQAKARLKARAVEMGYLDADFKLHEIRIAEGALTARVLLTLDTGARYLFGPVRIEGAEDYPEPYLDRFLAFKPDEIFSYAKLGETQLNFANSERFREVVVTPEREKAQGARVPVLIRLTQAPRRTLRPGVGYGTDTGARFTVRYRDLNMFHRGHDLDLTLYGAELLQGFAGRYTIPAAHDLKGSTSFQLNLQQEDVATYSSSLVSLEVARNHSFGKGELGTAYVKVLQEGFTIGGETSSSLLVLPGYRFSKENFDDLMRPSRGYRFSVDLRGTHEFLGSASSLAQFIGYGNTVIPLPWRLSLHLRGQFGATMLADPLADLPPSIRFFAGGDQSVRGYSYQSLGPRNLFGEVIGGRHLVFTSVEVERAIFDKWGVSLFHDAGNAFNDFTNIELFQGAGVGLHYYTPVGGLNLSLAQQIGTGRAVYKIHFTVGFQL